MGYKTIALTSKEYSLMQKIKHQIEKEQNRNLSYGEVTEIVCKKWLEEDKK